MIIDRILSHANLSERREEIIDMLCKHKEFPVKMKTEHERRKKREERLRQREEKLARLGKEKAKSAVKEEKDVVVKKETDAKPTHKDRIPEEKAEVFLLKRRVTDKKHVKDNKDFSPSGQQETGVALKVKTSKGGDALKKEGKDETGVALKVKTSKGGDALKKEGKDETGVALKVKTSKEGKDEKGVDALKKEGKEETKIVLEVKASKATTPSPQKEWNKDEDKTTTPSTQTREGERVAKPKETDVIREVHSASLKAILSHTSSPSSLPYKTRLWASISPSREPPAYLRSYWIFR